MLSIIIPSKNEIFLERTIRDLLAKAAGEIEILPVLDGYEPPANEIVNDPRVHYIRVDSIGMRAAINVAVAQAKGEFLMKIDAHCIVDQGFDQKLAADCTDNMVVIPRRHKLNDEKWEADMSETVDYEHFIWPHKFDPISLHGFRWTRRTLDRKNELIDDTLSFQGSCWFMKRSHFEKNKFLTDPGYKGMPQQEAEEIGLTTWLSGGRVVVNKKTWYAHLFKGAKYGRGYFLDRGFARDCYRYSFNHWVVERKPEFTKLIEKFMPIPGWPQDWKEKLWTPKNT